MDIKYLGRYFLYSTLLFGIIIVVGKIDIHLKQIVSETYRLFPSIIFRCFLYIPVGIVLGLPMLMNERKKEGKWKFNYIKAVLVGLPAFYFTFYFVIHSLIGFINYPFLLIISSMPVYIVGGIVFGFIIMTSFYKDNIRT